MLSHSAALCALAAPTVNSYKRLNLDRSISLARWAPTHVTHGPDNRTALLRTLGGRFEWRLPDASANPYLACAALIAAGIDGIEHSLALPEATEDDLTGLSPFEIAGRGIALLPQSLGQALDALDADPVINAALGPMLCQQFIDLKRVEFNDHARHVSDWELQRYATAH